MNKRTLSLILAVVLLLSLTACAKAPVPNLPDVPAAAEPAEAAPKAPAAKAEAPAPAPEENKLLAINARINGKPEKTFTGSAEFLARAVLPEGMAVDHWEINGKTVDAQGRRYTLLFTADSSALIKAVLRPELSVTSINASMRFLNEEGVPAGEKFDHFVFEKDYVNLATNATHPAGAITVEVKAEVPEGFEIDYWLFNDVPYFFDDEVESFIVTDLDVTMVYEIVLRKGDAAPTDPLTLMTPAGATTLIPGDEPFVPGPDDPFGYEFDDPENPFGVEVDDPENPFGVEEDDPENPFGVEEDDPVPGGATPAPGNSAPPSAPPASEATPKPNKPKPKPTPQPTPEPTPAPTPTPKPKFSAVDGGNNNTSYPSASAPGTTYPWGDPSAPPVIN